MLVHTISNLTLVGAAGLVLVLVIAGAAKGLIGVGMPIVAVPLVSHFIELPAAVALLSLPLVLSNLGQALEGGDTLPALKRLMPVLAGFAVGIFLGVGILLSLEAAWLKPLVGAALLIAVLAAGLKPHLTISPTTEKIVGPIAGLLGGVFGGIAALPGPIVFLYLLTTAHGKSNFVKSASLYLVCSSAGLALVLSRFAHLSLLDAATSALAVIPVFIGMAFGARLRPYVPSRVFRILVLAVVVASAVDLLTASLVRGSA
jgi:hypothetical protein